MADRTHLHRAAQRGDIGAVRALVQAVDVNVRGGWRIESPLHAASRAGRAEVVACLTQAGAYTEIRDRNNDTPLLLASWLGHSGAVRQLLRAGACVNAEGIPRSALHCACMQGHVECVTELLRAGADESALDEDGNTAMEVAGTMMESQETANNISAIAKMLRQAPADRSWRRRGWLVLTRARESKTIATVPFVSIVPTVVTRGAAKRAIAEVAAPTVGRTVCTQAQTAKSMREVATRCSGSGRAVGQSDAKAPKRSSVVALAEHCPAKRKDSRKSSAGQRAMLPVSARRRESESDRRALRGLVARLIDVGEEGAFRCVVSYL